MTRIKRNFLNILVAVVIIGFGAWLLTAITDSLIIIILGIIVLGVIVGFVSDRYFVTETTSDPDPEPEVEGTGPAGF